MQNHPLHTMLLGASWHWRTLYRWLIAYWYYRTSGLACWIASHGEEEFWNGMLLAAHTDKLSPLGVEWPRGEGRTSFHGNRAIKALGENQYIFGDAPGDMIKVFINGGPMYEEIEKRVRANQTLTEGDAFMVCTDLHELDICHVNFPKWLPWVYPSRTVSQLRAEVGPWSACSGLAEQLMKVLKRGASR